VRSKRIHLEAVLRSIKINHLLLRRFPVVETVHPNTYPFIYFYLVPLTSIAKTNTLFEHISFSPRSRDLPNGRLPIGFSSSIVVLNNDPCFRHARLAHIVHLFAFSFVISGLRKSSSSGSLSFSPNSSVFFLEFSSQTLLVSIYLSR